MTNDKFFQAIGQIRGRVQREGEGDRLTVTVGGKRYPLFYPWGRKRVARALARDIGEDGSEKRLIVHPRAVHFPDRDRRQVLTFAILRFGEPTSFPMPSLDVRDGQFLLRGVWRFIPVCSLPVISIYRNRSAKSIIDRTDSKMASRLLKAQHLPTLWQSAPVSPFKHVEGVEGTPPFVQVRAKLLPSKDCFAVVSEIQEHLEDAPPYLKRRKGGERRRVEKPVPKATT